MRERESDAGVQMYVSRASWLLVLLPGLSSGLRLIAHVQMERVGYGDDTSQTVRNGSAL